jgi:hypothetical protein
VRDVFLSRQSDDVDLTTDAPPERVLEMTGDWADKVSAVPGLPPSVDAKSSMQARSPPIPAASTARYRASLSGVRQRCHSGRAILLCLSC